MSKLSKDTKQRIVISLTSEFSGKELIDAIENAGAGSGDEYALKDLSNIAGTAIPAGVNLESSSIDQTTATGFALRTKNQTTSVSGRVQIRTGTADGSFTSGGINIESGFVTNALGGSSTSLMTGSTLMTSGSISSGTRGSTGSSFVRSGSVVAPSAISYSGNTGTVGVSSGPMAALASGATISGTTGFASLITGSIQAAATGATANASSGNILVSTGGISTTAEGAIVNGNTGSATFSSGVVSGGFSASGTSTSNTGSVNLNSGNITNANNTGNTGSVNIFSGSNSGTGITGNINITTGQRAGNLPRGSIFLNGQGTQISLRNYDVTGDHSLFNIYNDSPGGYGSIQFLTYAMGNNTMGMRIFDSSSSSGFSIRGWGRLNENGGPFDFISTGVTPSTDGALTGGDFNISSGSTGNVFPPLGFNNSINSGNINIFTPNGWISGTNTDSNSGNINLTTGQKTGSGIRGNITMNSKETTIVSDFVKLQNYTRLVLEDNFGDQLVRLQLTSPTAEGYGQFFFNRIRSDKEVFIGAMESHVDDDGAPVVFSGTFSLSDTDGQYKTSDVSLQTLSNSGFRDAPNVAVSSGNINIRTHNSFVQGTETDANTGNITLQTGAPSGAGIRGSVNINASKLDLQNTKVVNSSEFYFGDPDTDGTWRIRPDGGNLISEVRQGGVWIVRQTISPV